MQDKQVNIDYVKNHILSVIGRYTSRNPINIEILRNIIEDMFIIHNYQGYENLDNLLNIDDFDTLHNIIKNKKNYNFDKCSIILLNNIHKFVEKIINSIIKQYSRIKPQ